MSDQNRHRRGFLLTANHHRRRSRGQGLPGAWRQQSLFPWRYPCLCSCRRYLKGSLTPRQQICAACAGARVAGIPSRGNWARINSLLHHPPWFLAFYRWIREEKKKRKTGLAMKLPFVIGGGRGFHLISMTFFTVWLAIQLPAVARESVATTIPPWNRNASVVVPCAILIGQSGFAASSVTARRNAKG